jgi:hypothetical protein
MGLSNQFETSIVFDWSEFDLAKFDCVSGSMSIKNIQNVGQDLF